MKKEEKITDSARFRDFAEKLMEATPKIADDLSGMSPEDMACLIHELRVHQVELKVQNEELRRIQNELEKTRDCYSHLYDFAPVGYLSVNENGWIQEANLTAANMLGVERSFIKGKLFSRFIEKDFQDIFYLHRQKLFETKLPQICELKLKKNQNGPFDVRLESIFVKDDEAAAAQLRIALIDISEKKETEDELKKTHERLESDVKERTKELVQINLALSKSDQHRQMLSKELIRLLEKDRHQVAMELHDQIGQGMTSLKIGIELAEKQLTAEQSALKVLLKIESDRISQLLKDIKRISQGLRPSTLDKLGLVPSIQNLLNELQEKISAPITFFVKHIPKRLSLEKELAIYRIIQEALNNIQKHARTKTIHVNMIGRNGVISLSIEDNGDGFNLKKSLKVTKGKTSLGLLIMRERVEQLDGEFSIDTKIGRGTIIMAEIPI